jgi:hypothetical protein
MLWPFHFSTLCDWYSHHNEKKEMVRKRRITFTEPPQPQSRQESINDLAPTDVRRLTLPVVTIIGLVSFFAWFTWEAAIERSAIRHRLTSIEAVDVSIQRQHDNIISIFRTHAERSAETWTKNDHDLWCLKAQIQNPGWKCPDLKNVDGDWFSRLRQLEELEHPELMVTKPSKDSALPATSPNQNDSKKK